MYEQEKWELRRQAARQLGLDSIEDVGLLVVQPLSRATVRVSGERRARLLARLTALASKEAGEIQRDDPQAPGSPQVEAVCRACRGSCCRNGAEHAYLRPGDLQRVREDLPQTGAEALVGLYMGFVPKRAYRNSCIFHSATGCSLPRRLRSRTCLKFFCGPMKTLQVRELEPATAVTLVVLPAAPKARQVVIRHVAGVGP